MFWQGSKYAILILQVLDLPSSGRVTGGGRHWPYRTFSPHVFTAFLQGRTNQKNDCSSCLVVADFGFLEFSDLFQDLSDIVPDFLAARFDLQRLLE